MYLHGGGRTHSTSAHTAGRSLAVGLPVSFRCDLFVDRLVVLLTTTSQTVKPVSPEAVLRRDRGGFERTLVGLELMNSRAEENIEESPEPSDEAFFTTSSSLTSYTHARENTVRETRGT